MRSHTTARAAAVAAFLAAFPVAAAAQGVPSTDGVGRDRPLSLGLATGFVRGTALDPGAGASVGYHGLVTLEARTPWRPLRLRAEGLFADWGSGQASAVAGSVLLAPLPTRISPYLIAGAGVQPAGDARPTWALGLGARFPLAGRTAFVEGRMHAHRQDGAVLAPWGPTNRWRYFVTPIGLGVQF